jgi:hypothetical protein
MDLTKSYPASVREQMHGLVQLKRTIDKGKALAQGTIGEYNYNCAMDKHLFEFLGIDHEELLDIIKSASNDGEVSEFVAPYVHAKDDAEIETFNKEWLVFGPEKGSPAEGFFLKLRSEVAPDRTDVTSWADVLDLDEKRPVPHRVAA